MGWRRKNSARYAVNLMEAYTTTPPKDNIPIAIPWFLFTTITGQPVVPRKYLNHVLIQEVEYPVKVLRRLEKYVGPQVAMPAALEDVKDRVFLPDYGREFFS